MKTHTKGRLFEGLLIVVTLVWGTGFPITDIALRNGFTTLMLMAARFVIATFVLMLIFSKHLKFFSKKHLWAGVATGLFLFLGFYFQTKGLEYTTPSKNAFLTQVCVIFTPFLSWVVFHKQPPLKAFIASFISILGIFILTNAYRGINTVSLGDFLTLIAAVTITFHVVLTAYFIEKFNLDAIMFTLVQFAFVALISLSAIFILEQEIVLNLGDYLNTEKSWFILIFPLLYLGFLNTAFGFTIQTLAIKYTSPVRTSIIVSQEALIGTIASIIIIGEHLTINIIIGGFLIVFALLVSETEILAKIVKLGKRGKLEK